MHTTIALQNNCDSIERDQRIYLENRLDKARRQKNADMQKHFGFEDHDRPTSPDEMIARITEGKYSIRKADEKNDDGSDVYYSSPWYYIRWHDPSVKKDKDGFNRAKETLEKSIQETRDAIVIKSPADGLAAIQAFETTTFH